MGGVGRAPGCRWDGETADGVRAELPHAEGDTELVLPPPAQHGEGRELDPPGSSVGAGRDQHWWHFDGTLMASGLLAGSLWGQCRTGTFVTQAGTPTCPTPGTGGRIVSQGLRLLPQGFLQPQKAFSPSKKSFVTHSPQQPRAGVSLSRCHTPLCVPGASPAIPVPRPCRNTLGAPGRAANSISSLWRQGLGIPGDSQGVSSVSSPGWHSPCEIITGGAHREFPGPSQAPSPGYRDGLWMPRAVSGALPSPLPFSLAQSEAAPRSQGSVFLHWRHPRLGSRALPWPGSLRRVRLGTTPRELAPGAAGNTGKTQQRCCRAPAAAVGIPEGPSSLCLCRVEPFQPSSNSSRLFLSLEGAGEGTTAQSPAQAA